jgi:hypothetical protein
MESLFTGRDPLTGADPHFDAPLEKAFRSQRSASICRQPAANPQTKPATTYIRVAEAPTSPLLRVYWMICTVLLLALIQMGCDANRLGPTSNAAPPRTAAYRPSCARSQNQA